ncbi:MAG: radical SAM family heme chaperone HemW [Syntrophales bacterium]
MNLPGLYIHIPFCRTKCPYCHFYSITDMSAVDMVIAAIVREMELYTGEFDTFDTIYIGGGTPSLLSISQLETILSAVRKHFSVPTDGEITIEANPADGNLVWYRSLRDIGVNRLHLGVQSFSDRALTFLGRRHRADDALAALDSAVRAGFDNFGLDLIYGIPGQDLQSWGESLARAVSLSPPHLSAYQLAIEAETPLWQSHRRGSFEIPGEDASLAFFLETSAYLERSGYQHYEVSNYAASPARKSRHNQKYWDHTPYLGIGPGAHSFKDGRRWWNHRSIEGYLNDLASGKRPVGGEETLTREDLRLETLFMSLRTARGIDLAGFRLQFGEELSKERPALIQSLVDRGFIVVNDERISPTTRGLAIADQLALTF